MPTLNVFHLCALMSNQLPPDIATSTKLHRLKRRPTDARTADPDAEMITTEAELKMIDAIVQYRSNRITLSQSKASKSVTKDMSLAPDGEPATVFPLAEYRRFPSRAIARIYYRIQSWKPQNIPYNRELLLALLFEPPFVQSPLLSTTSERAWTDYNPVSDIAHTSATLDFNRIVTGRLTVCGLSVYAEPVSDLMELLQDPPLDPDDSPTMAVCRVFTARHRMTDPDGCEEIHLQALACAILLDQPFDFGNPFEWILVDAEIGSSGENRADEILVNKPSTGGLDPTSHMVR